jgi:hypothetical protein
LAVRAGAVECGKAAGRRRAEPRRAISGGMIPAANVHGSIFTRSGPR